MNYVISYDLGTTGVKTCIYSIDDRINPVASAQMGYQLFILENGGAAALAGVGLGLIRSLDDVKQLIPVSTVYEPDPVNREVYDRNYEVFKTLYKNNRHAFHALAKH